MYNNNVAGATANADATTNYSELMNDFMNEPVSDMLCST